MPEKVSEVTLVLVASSVIIILLAGTIVFSLLTNQKRKFRHRQQLIDLKNQFDNEVLRTQLEIQTQTFETISRELHDNVSNTLSVALLNLNLIVNGKDGESSRRLEESKSLLLEAKNAVKDFSWYINPENISSIGLLTSLKHLIEKFAGLKLYQINYIVNGEEFPIETSRQIVIYRIIQESLNNIVKHAEGSKVELTISFELPVLTIKIRDNGCGFDLEKVLRESVNTHGAGIKNMISRAKMIHADLEINSQPGEGTTTLLSYNVNSQAPVFKKQYETR